MPDRTVTCPASSRPCIPARRAADELQTPTASACGSPRALAAAPVIATAINQAHDTGVSLAWHSELRRASSTSSVYRLHGPTIARSLPSFNRCTSDHREPARHHERSAQTSRVPARPSRRFQTPAARVKPSRRTSVADVAVSLLAAACQACRRRCRRRLPPPARRPTCRCSSPVCSSTRRAHSWEARQHERLPCLRAGRAERHPAPGWCAGAGPCAAMRRHAPRAAALRLQPGLPAPCGASAPALARPPRSCHLQAGSCGSWCPSPAAWRSRR